MKSTRRDFLRRSAAVGSAAVCTAALLPEALTTKASAAKPTKKKLKILMLGGTGFLGPHTVRVAISRGHEMTLFNRGKSNPHLFPDLEKLRGDRYSDLSALKSNRKWDAVIDPFTYVPRTVKATAELLADRVQHYIVISTISVYKEYSKPNMTEDAPLEEVAPDVVERIKHHREVMPYYGGMKALCEQAAEKVMPGRVANVRPGLIVGPGDPSDRFTYWPVRVSHGGETLCPNSPKDLVQNIDVRDLAEFVITTVEKRLLGAYNATSPGGERTIGQVLDESKKITGSDAKFTWVPNSFLEEQKVAPWSDMPAWLPAEGEYAGFGTINTAKAQAEGLTCRKLPATISATLKWWQEQSEERRAKLRAGIAADREKEVLAAWHKKNKESEG